MTTATTDAPMIADRVHQLDWEALDQELDQRGFAVTPRVFNARACGELADLFDGDGFRSTIDMARHRFGDGRYRYFAHPLPAVIEGAWSAFYEHLAPSRTLGPPGSPATTPPSRQPTMSCWSAAGRPARSGLRR